MGWRWKFAPTGTVSHTSSSGAQGRFQGKQKGGQERKGEVWVKVLYGCWRMVKDKNTETVRGKNRSLSFDKKFTFKTKEEKEKRSYGIVEEEEEKGNKT